MRERMRRAYIPWPLESKLGAGREKPNFWTLSEACSRANAIRNVLSPRILRLVTCYWVGPCLLLSPVRLAARFCHTNEFNESKRSARRPDEETFDLPGR